jgi:molybdopterin synthase sulfur carrier subunit
MPKVTVPPPYRGPTGGEGVIVVDGATVSECLDAVEARYPGFRQQVLSRDGRTHKFVKLFVNGEQIEPDALDTAVGQDDEVEVLAAIAGG